NQQGQGSGNPQQGSGSGSAGSNGDPSGQTGPSQRQNRGRTEPKSPDTPSDQKLDELETFSRRLQRDEARRRASGRSADPLKDW
ncbi:MAG: hypothetical protein H6Q90_3309, partial [Deltaproteobacteria bacterium]|nr:hypothetical protein [Deltaproteobacteria bacterium]